MRRREPKVATLGDLLCNGNDISAWCRRCRHSSGPLIVDDLIARFGPDASCEAVCRALRCTACGARDGDFNLSPRSMRGATMTRLPPAGPGRT